MLCFACARASCLITWDVLHNEDHFYLHQLTNAVGCALPFERGDNFPGSDNRFLCLATLQVQHWQEYLATLGLKVQRPK